MNEDLKRLLGSREWRLNNLYWIEGKDGQPIRFRMNWAQEHLHKNLWYRNDILKVRQLGISTYTAMLMLDACLFTPGYHCGIIDKGLDDAKDKLDKIRFGYEMLDYVPDYGATDIDRGIAEIGAAIKARVSIKRDKETLIVFENKSLVKIGTSLRGGTYQLLHISELGYVAANDPKRAKKIITGGLNAVGKEAFVIKESTHEGGRTGENYRLTVEAMENVGHKLSSLDYRFFFFSWINHPEYRLEGARPALKASLVEYFASLEQKGIVLDDAQKAWYASQEKQNGAMVTQEYPTTPEEAFEVPLEGAIYGSWMSALRARGKVKMDFVRDSLAPLFVSWDLGRADNMSMWLIQKVSNMQYLALNHYQANDFEVSHYIEVVRRWEAKYGAIYKHLVPHDAAQRDFNLTDFEGHLNKGGIVNIAKVKRTPDVWASIDLVRQLLPHFNFHMDCSDAIVEGEMKYVSGVEALENYHKKANGSIDHDAHYSHSADSFRCFVEADEQGLTEYRPRIYKPRKAILTDDDARIRKESIWSDDDDW